MAENDILQQTKKILSSTLHGVYILYGCEEFLKRHFLLDMKKKLLNPEYSDLNFSVCAGVDAVIEGETTFSALPQFDSHRLTVWYNTGFPNVLERKRSDFDYALDSAANNPDLVTVIYIYDSEIDYQGTRALSKYKLKSGILNATVLNFDFLPSAKLGKWIDRHFAAEGVTISEADNAALANRCGKDMNALVGQIDKLCVYVKETGRTAVTSEDIESIVPKSAEFDGFFVSNAVRMRNSQALLEYIENAEKSGEIPLVILSIIAKEATTLYSAKLAKKEGVGYVDFAKATGIKEYPAKLCYSAVAQNTEGYYQRLVGLVRDTELAMKSTATDNFELLRELVCEL